MSIKTQNRPGAAKRRAPRGTDAAPASTAGENVSEKEVDENGQPVVRRFKIAPRDLKIGMFVAELDRPWLDTPFLIQGFIIEAESELKSLAQHCKYVFVDLDLSDPSVVDDIRAAEMKKLPIEENGQHRARREPFQFKTNDRSGQEKPLKNRKISNDGRARFKNYLKLVDPSVSVHDNSIVGRISALLDRLFSKKEDRAKLAADAKQRVTELRKTLPPNIKLRKYKDKVSVEEELPRARETFSRSEKTLQALAKDVKSGRLPSLEKTNEVVDDIVQSMIDNPDAMMWVARMRDEDLTTYGHAVKVALYMVALGRHMGFPKKELSNLGMIGLLADVGKTKLPKALLEKPGMLSPQEYTLVKEHVRLGLEALSQEGPLPPDILQGIAQHHERLDGSGYPKGLKGPGIGIYGRMAAIADTFAALITPRVYANPVSPHDALLNLFEWAGTSFHEPLVEQFVQAIGVFPVGSMVELSTKEVAVVLAHNKVRRLEPRVLVLTWIDKRPLETPMERNLFDKPKGTDGKPIRILRAVPAGSYGIQVKDYYGADAMANANGLI